MFGKNLTPAPIPPPMSRSFWLYCGCSGKSQSTTKRHAQLPCSPTGLRRPQLAWTTTLPSTLPFVSRTPLFSADTSVFPSHYELSSFMVVGRGQKRRAASAGRNNLTSIYFLLIIRHFCPIHPHPQISRPCATPPPRANHQGLVPSPCVTFRLVVAPLRGPGRSPVLPFACCVGSLLSVGRCGWCSCWCRFLVRGAQ